MATYTWDLILNLNLASVHYGTSDALSSLAHDAMVKLFGELTITQ